VLKRWPRSPTPWSGRPMTRLLRAGYRSGAGTLPSRARVLPFLAIAGALCLQPVRAQSSGEDTLPVWSPPAEVVSAVKAAIASRWGVDEEALQFRWTRPRWPLPASHGWQVTVLGTGRNGRWMAVLSRPDGNEERASLPFRSGILCDQVFASGPMERGAILSPRSMVTRPHVHWGPPDDIPPPAEFGWVTQRRIGTGEILTRPHVRPPELVVSGRPVRLVWTSGSLTLSVDGKAVGSGALGERIFVRTEDGHRMAGVVSGPGTVAVSGNQGE